MIVTLPNRFTPREYQRRHMAALDNGVKRALAVWHRRAGKDLTDLHQKCKMAHDRVGMYWHCLPSYEQARKSIWNGFTRSGERIMEQVFPSAIRKSPRQWNPQGEMLVELKCGSMMQLVGSDGIDNVVGAGPLHVTFSEYALSRPSAWDLVRPMLEENGGSASFISTPRGRNHFHALYEVAKANPREWFAELVDVFQSGAFPDPQAVLDKARREGMPEALIRQEWLCDFTAANVGSVWGDLIERLEGDGALDDFQHDRDDVYTSWDLGFRDSTAVWLWRVEDHRVDFVAHHAAHGKPLSYYFDWLDARAESEGYKYDTHWLPHDARAHTLVTGTSVQEQFRERYPGKVSIAPKLSLLDGIQAVRRMLQGKVRIHPRCGEGIEALRQYRYEYDEDARTFSSRPEHSVWSHSADAFRYAAMVVEPMARHERRVFDAASKEAPRVEDMDGFVYVGADGRYYAKGWTFKKLADAARRWRGRRQRV